MSFLFFILLALNARPALYCTVTHRLYRSGEFPIYMAIPNIEKSNGEYIR